MKLEPQIIAFCISIVYAVYALILELKGINPGDQLLISVLFGIIAIMVK